MLGSAFTREASGRIVVALLVVFKAPTLSSLLNKSRMFGKRKELVGLHYGINPTIPF
jgi:hypothetical protein